MRRDPKSIAFYAAVARRLRLAREDAGISQERLGSRIGLGQAQIAVLESGDAICSLQHATRVAKALDIPIEALVADPVDA